MKRIAISGATRHTPQRPPPPMTSPPRDSRPRDPPGARPRTSADAEALPVLGAPEQRPVDAPRHPLPLARHVDLPPAGPRSRWPRSLLLLLRPRLAGGRAPPRGRTRRAATAGHGRPLAPDACRRAPRPDLSRRADPPLRRPQRPDPPRDRPAHRPGRRGGPLRPSTLAVVGGLRSPSQRPRRSRRGAKRHGPEGPHTPGSQRGRRRGPHRTARSANAASGASASGAAPYHARCARSDVRADSRTGSSASA